VAITFSATASGIQLTPRWSPAPPPGGELGALLPSKLHGAAPVRRRTSAKNKF